MAGNAVEQKEEARAALLEKRRALSSQWMESASVLAQRQLASLAPWQRARTVALYLPTHGEVDTMKLWESALARGAVCAFPVVQPGTRLLAFRQALGPGDFEAGPLHTRQPHPQSPAVALGSIDLFVVPGLGFTLRGERLGRGKGYYDATLAAVPHIPRVGLTWEALLCPALPTEPHDVTMHWLATEARLLLVGG